MKIFFLLIFAVFSMGHLSAQPMHEVLQKYLEAVGGVDKIRGINSYYLHQVYTTALYEDTAHYRVKQQITYYKAPYTRIELHYDGNKMLIAFLSPEGITLTGRGDRMYKKRDKKARENMESGHLLNHLGGVRYILKAIEENAITFTDTVAMDGKQYYKFTTTLQNTVNFYINATTYRLERYEANTGAYSIYSGFKTINGVLVPTVMTRHSAEDDEVYEQHETAMLDINIFIPDKYFSKEYIKL